MTAPMDPGEVAHLLNLAAVSGATFPASVPDTPENHELFAQILRAIAAMPPGVIPDVPQDYTGY